MTIRGHLMWLVVVAVIPVLGFSAAMIVKVTEQQRAAMTGELKDSAARLAVEVDTELRETISALEVLALSSALADDNLPAFYVLAKRLLADRPNWANLALMGPAGEHFVNLRVPYGTPLPPLNRPVLFRNVGETRQPIVSGLVPGTLTGRPLTAVAVPVFRGANVKYVLTGAIDVGNWEKFLRERLPSGLYATLVDRDHVIVARTLEGERFVGAKPVANFVEAMQRQPFGGMLEGPTLEGSKGYGAYQRSPFSGWTVGVFVPADALEGPVRTLFIQLALGFLFLLGLSLAIAWLLGRRIAYPIAQLTRSVRSVGAGGRPLPVEPGIAEVREAGAALQDAAGLLAERLAREHAARTGLESADKAKDAYLAMLAHELRNPLAPVNASLYVLQREGVASDPARRAVGVIGRQVNRLNRLLEDLLDVTRLANGTVQLQRQEASLNEIVRLAAEDHAELASKAEVALDVAVPDREVRIHADATRLAQMVSNLLQNALRFTPAGGRISVSLAAAGPQAEIRVRDTGAGIEPALMPRLFDPFARGAQEGARSRAGLGLGLAVVKGIAELHGGSVRAASEGPGRGAEFVVTLPTNDKSSQGGA